MKQHATFITILALAILVIIIGNVYFFYPSQVLKLPEVANPKSQQARAGGVESDRFEETKRIIKSEGSKPGSGESLRSSEVKRNPLLWPGEKFDQPNGIVPPPPPPPPPVQLPSLRMVLIGEKGKLALLDESLVSEGNHYKEHTVTEIGKDWVLLSGYYGERRVSLPD